MLFLAKFRGLVGLRTSDSLKIPFRWCIRRRYSTLNSPRNDVTGRLPPQSKPQPLDFSSNHERKIKIRSMINYTFASVFFVGGLGFAFVPMYNAFCSATNYGGTITIDLNRDKTKNLKRVDDHELTIAFNADKSSYLQWNFQPLQPDIKVVPGETVLAFYTAENPTDKPISGISTYNVIPYEAARYFNKIQCFCFDEQRLNPHEQVDMPVFFYIDPEIIQDPYLFNVKEITLSYTFFEAVEGFELPFMAKAEPLSNVN